MATKKSPKKEGETLEEERPQCNDLAEDEQYIKEHAVTVPPLTCGCEETKAQVVTCYEKNPTESIECKRLVEEFETCVKERTNDFLLKKPKNEEK